MAIYDHDENWMYRAVADALQLSSEASSDTQEITKQAFDVGLGAGALLGGLFGAGATSVLTSGSIENKYKNIYGNAVAKVVTENNKKISDINNDHYTQLANVNRDLKVIFTPFSVVFQLHNTVVDTISIDTMNASMKNAWRNKDDNYFRNLLVNKVYLDAQDAEQLFIKRMLDQSKLSQEALSKQSSDIPTADVPEDYNVFEVLAGVGMLHKLALASKTSTAIDKYAEYLLNTFNTWEDIPIPVEAGTQKLASDLDYDLGLTKLGFLMFGHKDSNVEVMTPENIKKNLSIVYLPDRVLFLSDNVVVTQLNSMGMNEDGYEKFQNRDDGFFKKLFFDKAKEANFIDQDFTLEKEADETPLKTRFEVPNLNEVTPEAVVDSETEKTALKEEIEHIVKEAGSIPGELMKMGGIHPLVYKEFMDKHFTDWLTWDMDTMESMITDFIGSAPSDKVLTKLMSISTCMNSDAPFTGFHTFEKVVRAFNDKHVNFSLRESNISLGEIMFTMRIMQELLKAEDVNIYDNLGDHAFAYIVEVLADQECRVVDIKYKSDFERIFIDLVNADLLKYWVATLPSGLFNNAYMDSYAEAFTIVDAVHYVMDNFSKVSRAKFSVDIYALAEDYFDIHFPKQENNYTYTQIAANNVIGSAAVNMFLDSKDDLLKTQRSKYIG